MCECMEPTVLCQIYGPADIPERSRGWGWGEDDGFLYRKGKERKGSRDDGRIWLNRREDDVEAGANLCVPSQTRDF